MYSHAGSPCLDIGLSALGVGQACGLSDCSGDLRAVEQGDSLAD